jgi:hypothetical protein
MSRQTIPAPPEQLKKYTWVDRRVWIRYPCNLESFCQPLQGRAGKVICTARIADISNNGISLVVGTPFEVGMFLSLELISESRGLAPPILARVVHAKAQDNGNWLVGCELTSKLSNNELKDLLTR